MNLKTPDKKKLRKPTYFGIGWIILLVIAWAPVQSQDLHFSQFYDAPLLRNPSLAGIFSGDVRVQMVYRNQWNNFTNAYKTGSFNAEYKAPVWSGNDFLTIGIQLLYDKAGTVGLNTTQILPALNYHKSLNSNKTSYLSMGFMGGLVEKSINRAKIATNSQFDGTAYNPAMADGEDFLTTQYRYFDGSFGASFNSSFGQDDANTYYIGMAYHHFNRPRYTFYRTIESALNPKYVISAGIKFNLDEYSFLTIQGDYNKQGNYNETIAGMLYSYKIDDADEPLYVVHAGIFVRWKDALIPVIKMDVHPFSFSLSYDVNVSALKTVSKGRGGAELSISYIGFLDRYNSSRDKVLCPHF